jgi:hypothetical protein
MKVKETKPCARGIEFCDRTLPARSKHKYCTRCRGYDKKLDGMPLMWRRDRFITVSRWRYTIANHLPKKDLEASVVTFTPRDSKSRTHESRKRA